MEAGDLAYVWLHAGYTVSGQMHRESGDQCVAPIKVVRVLRNAYELAIPRSWAIHPVMSVEHLKPHPKDDDQ
jgi:hypothetical protein